MIERSDLYNALLSSTIGGDHANCLTHGDRRSASTCSVCWHSTAHLMALVTMASADTISAVIQRNTQQHIIVKMLDACEWPFGSGHSLFKPHFGLDSKSSMVVLVKLVPFPTLESRNSS